MAHCVLNGQFKKKTTDIKAKGLTIDHSPVRVPSYSINLDSGLDVTLICGYPLSISYDI